MALYDIGCFFGACVAMWMGEILGRKKTVLVGTTIMTIGAVIQISSYSGGTDDHGTNCGWHREWHQHIDSTGLGRQKRLL